MTIAFFILGVSAGLWYLRWRNATRHAAEAESQRTTAQTYRRLHEL